MLKCALLRLWVMTLEGWSWNYTLVLNVNSSYLAPPVLTRGPLSNVIHHPTLYTRIHIIQRY